MSWDDQQAAPSPPSWGCLTGKLYSTVILLLMRSDISEFINSSWWTLL